MQSGAGLARPSGFGSRSATRIGSLYGTAYTGEVTDLLKTPLYDDHVRLDGRLVPFAGFSLPIQYAGIKKEHEAVRQRAGLFDVSHMGELVLRGPDACAGVDGLITNDLKRIAAGRALYTCCCQESGTILDDLIVYKRAENDILVVCNASNRDKIARHFSKHAEGRCSFEDESDRFALIALQGPKAFDVLRSADAQVAQEVDDLKSFRFSACELAGQQATIARTGYTGEDGVEIFCGNDGALPIWSALLDAGAEPCGLGCRDTLRLEARLSLYGNEIDETTNPLEAGLGWTVKFDGADFVGKSALLAVKEQGLTRRLVGFEMTGRGVARPGYPLLRDGVPVGTCTSGGPSPTLGRNIGLGYLPVEIAEVGSEFLVDCRGREVSAKVVKTPFYKRARPS